MHLCFSAHLRHRCVTEFDGESIHRKESRKEVLHIPKRGEEGEDRVGNAQRVTDKKMPEGLVTSVRPICSQPQEKRKEETRE